MSEPRDYLEITYKSINCFANDGKLDAGELGKLLAIAERDGVIDENEKRVLRAIVKRVNPSEIDADMQNKLVELSEKIAD
ncbi:hypothetical protein L1F30_00615 [Simiduia sp. 21SJ11W-1]|uniref:hypothetical protein n=1 Tax=Simiduia sp. 21SJ11W-1 TaxID=2909669 RepID=UPI0020A06853|nr:hypothetical protein [Simiduia sp. 21SJ11W-1]UTA48057.1 hypothetical protein L1F30_00615 [Simiduia sp. 21SJ11W-1]